MATYCIICGERRPGVPIRDDRVLNAMRWFKRNVTRDERGNSLVVCRDDYSAYMKKRGRYTSRQALYIAVGVIFAALGLLVRFSLSTFAISIAVLAALYLLSLINYTPALSIAASGKDAKTRRKQQHKQ